MLMYQVLLASRVIFDELTICGCPPLIQPAKVIADTPTTAKSTAAGEHCAEASLELDAQRQARRVAAAGICVCELVMSRYMYAGFVSSVDLFWQRAGWQ